MYGSRDSLHPEGEWTGSQGGSSKKDDETGNETTFLEITLNNDILDKLMWRAVSGINSYEENEKKVDRDIWLGWCKVL